MGKFIHINTTSGDICSNQHPGGPVFEITQSPLTVILRFITMNSFCFDTYSDKIFYNFISTVFCACKNQRCFNGFIFKNICK